MAARSDILSQLRAAVEAIEAGQDEPEGVAPRTGQCAPVPSGHRDPGYEEALCDDRGDRPGNSAETEKKTAEAAFRKILRWASARERSSAYVRERLLKDEYPPEVVEEALKRAVRVRAIDDRRYGDALIRAKLSAGRGLRDAESEIEKLGIDPSSLAAWQEHTARGLDAEVDRALALLRRRPPRAKRAREAAFRKLVTQGFDTDVAVTAARRWSEETGVR